MSRQHNNGVIPALEKGPKRPENIDGVPVYSAEVFNPRHNLGILVSEGDVLTLNNVVLENTLFQKVHQDAQFFSQADTRQIAAYTRFPDGQIVYSHQVISVNPESNRGMTIVSFAISDLSVETRKEAELNSVSVKNPHEVKGYFTRVVVAHNATELNQSGKSFDILLKLKTPDLRLIKPIHEFLLANAEKMNTKDGRRSLLRALKREFGDIVESIEREKKPKNE